MNESSRARPHWRWVTLLAALAAATASAQVPVDDDGNPIGEYDAGDYEAHESADFPLDPELGEEDIPLLPPQELEELVGPIALYPDDLLAVVLPASTYPLQLVQAERFLEARESDPTLQPDEDWDDSVIALLNYPEVIALLNEDLDWTWRLGEAVVAQQADVISAVEGFRNRAYAAGNLKSDSHQNISHSSDGVIEIRPVEDDVIYVPYYEPERVVVYQPRPVYFYYPDPCPVYYYPYPSSYAFRRGYFWGVTTAFSIGWFSDSVHVIHHSYRGHPYYGRHYWDRWWYRRPSINIHNNYYVRNSIAVSRDRYYRGDRWRPRYTRSTLRSSDQRIVRNRHYRTPPSGNRYTRNSSRNGYAATPRKNDRRAIEHRRSGSVARDRTPDTVRNRTSANERNRTANTNRNRTTDTTRYRRDEPRRERATNKRFSASNDESRRSGSVRPPARVDTTRRSQSSAGRTEYRRQEPRRERVAPAQKYRQEPVRRPSAERQVRQRPPQVRKERPARTESRRSQPQRSTPQRSKPKQSSSNRRNGDGERR